MAYFLLRLNAPRASFPFDATEEENAAMQQHFGYWQDRAKAREAIFVGPVFDPAGPWGAAIVEVEDESAARGLGDGDPVVKASLGFRYDVISIPSAIVRQ